MIWHNLVLSLQRIKQLKLITMNDYFESVSLEEYEGILANREYWDDISAEWERSSTIEQKLIRLGTFVHRGGDLNRVIVLYAEDREYTYRVTIKSCLQKYIERLMTEKLWYTRIVRLEKEEVVKLLSELLKASVKKSCEYDKYNKKYYSLEVLDTKDLDSEGILAAIEQEHKETHPNETINVVRERAWKWMRDSLW